VRADSVLTPTSWSGFPLGATTVRKLYESCPDIKAIHITFPENMGQQIGYTRWHEQPDDRRRTERAIYGTPDLTVFSGLEELTLDNLYEELPWWRSQIVQLLKKSPGLQKLRLSLAANTLFLYKEWEDCAEFYYNFFDKLCVEYGAVASPLRIRSLHLGNAVLPFKLGRIQRLTDLSVLEDAHIENRKLFSAKGGFWSPGVPTCINPTEREWDPTDDDDMGYPHLSEEYHAVAFEVFGPANCPNLRRLTVGCYDDDLDEYLRHTAGPLGTRRLALSCVDMGFGKEPASLLLRDPVLHLRMLEIDLSWFSVLTSDSEFYWKDFPGLTTSHLRNPVKLILDRLVQGGHGTLEGLTVFLPANLVFDFVFDGPSPLLATLSQLHNLTQFSIEGFSKSKGQLRREAFPWVAEVCALRAPRLRYVKVCGMHWRILREGSARRVRLEELEDWEIDSVELFRGCIWKPQLMAGKLYTRTREVFTYWGDYGDLEMFSYGGERDSEEDSEDSEDDEVETPGEGEDWAAHLQGLGFSIAPGLGGD